MLPWATQRMIFQKHSQMTRHWSSASTIKARHPPTLNLLRLGKNQTRPVKVEEISAEQSRRRFNHACLTLLGIEGAEFEDRIDRGDYTGLDRPTAARVAMIRPSRRSDDG